MPAARADIAEVATNVNVADPPRGYGNDHRGDRDGPRGDRGYNDHRGRKLDDSFCRRYGPEKRNCEERVARCDHNTDDHSKDERRCQERVEHHFDEEKRNGRGRGY